MGARATMRRAKERDIFISIRVRLSARARRVKNSPARRPARRFENEETKSREKITRTATGLYIRKSDSLHISMSRRGQPARERGSFRARLNDLIARAVILRLRYWRHGREREKCHFEGRDAGMLIAGCCWPKLRDK